MTKFQAGGAYRGGAYKNAFSLQSHLKQLYHGLRTKGALDKEVETMGYRPFFENIAANLNQKLLLVFMCFLCENNSGILRTNLIQHVRRFCSFLYSRRIIFGVEKDEIQ